MPGVTEQQIAVAYLEQRQSCKNHRGRCLFLLLSDPGRHCQAAARGYQVLWLTPWEHNHRALAFYARRGYTDCGETDHLIEGERFGNRVFAKGLVAGH